MKVCVLGRKDFCIGFYIAGISDVYIVDTDTEFNHKLKTLLSDESIGIIILDDTLNITREVHKHYISKSKAIIVYLNEIDQIKKELKDALGIEVLK
ncbi:MAG: hypothetical protein NZ908_01555 [Candidatus Micrarchaeota archaeon]|nr:hypothetical protein [Candidatus Micrarchaeota archaeon]MCX8154383.1 hypothetical protein [Candidatus Micrarchaeota archaeon]